MFYSTLFLKKSLKTKLRHCKCNAAQNTEAMFWATVKTAFTAGSPPLCHQHSGNVDYPCRNVGDLEQGLELVNVSIHWCLHLSVWRIGTGDVFSLNRHAACGRRGGEQGQGSNCELDMAPFFSHSVTAGEWYWVSVEAWAWQVKQLKQMEGCGSIYVFLSGVFQFSVVVGLHKNINTK